jgi:phosphoenolpyruvate-protein kinase (PTS system EI component)
MMTLLSPSRFVLDDARLRGRMIKHVEAGSSAEDAVEHVMREYTRVLSSSGDPVLTDRALEVEALCLRVMHELGAAQPPIAPGSVLCASRLTVCDALEFAAGHGVAVALTHAADGSPGVAVACALGLPVVCGLGELYRWVADGDRALVNAAEGTVVLNPSRVAVAEFRRR